MYVRLDYQPLFGKGARAPPLISGRNIDRTRESGGNGAYMYVLTIIPRQGI